MLLDILEPDQNLDKKQEPDFIVGIDFGTTNSLLAFYDGQEVHFTLSDLSEELFQSKLEIDGHYIPSIKRLFGRSYTDILSSNLISDSLKAKIIDENGAPLLVTGKGKYHIVEIGARIFTKLKLAAEEQFGRVVEHAVVTVPAYFDDAAKTMVRNAAKLAGINVVRLIAEPTAAAYSYGLDSGLEGNYIVYDFGGGTFDISILKMKMGAFQVVALSGDNALGGDDIDRLISEYIALRHFNDRKDSEDLLLVSREMKENLGANFYVDGVNLSLSQGELSVIAAQPVDRTIQLIKKTIFESQLNEFSGLILVGGSSKMPIIRQKINESFPNLKIIESVDSDRVVAMGAAQQAWNIASKGGDVLIDAIPLSLGIELMGGLVDRIIQRNTSVPTSSQRKFTTYVDNQTGFDLHVVQGDRELAKDCRSLARFSIKGIPPMIAGKAVLNIGFNVDPDGLLTISAYEEVSGIKQDVEIKPSFGISEEKIYDMLKETVANIESDYEIAQIIEKKIELEAMVARLTSIIEVENFKQGEAAQILEACGEITASIDEYDAKLLEEKINYLSTLAAGFIDDYISSGFKHLLQGRNITEAI